MIVIQIFTELSLPACIIFFSMPQLHFQDKLFTVIIHNHICTPLIPCLRLYIIISRSIDDRSKI